MSSILLPGERSDSLRKIKEIQELIQGVKAKSESNKIKLIRQQANLLELVSKSDRLAERAKVFDKSAHKLDSKSNAYVLPALALAAVGFGLYRLKRYFD